MRGSPADRGSDPPEAKRPSRSRLPGVAPGDPLAHVAARLLAAEALHVLDAPDPEQRLLERRPFVSGDASIPHGPAHVLFEVLGAEALHVAHGPDLCERP